VNSSTKRHRPDSGGIPMTSLSLVRRMALAIWKCNP
jgi:hypothetical protein